MFLLLYALGASCGMASYGETVHIQLLPSIFSMLTDGAWRAVLVRAVLYCGAAAIAQASFVLFTGLSAWLLPLWAGGVLLRAVSVGACAQLCLNVLRTGIAHAELIVLILGVQFAAVFPAEMRLGILPLARRTEPDMGDAEYLAIGLRTALFYILLSLVLTTVALYALSRVHAV